MRFPFVYLALAIRVPSMGQGELTPGYVKLLLPPRQSRGNSHFGLECGHIAMTRRPRFTLWQSRKSRKAQSSSASRVTAQNILGPEIFRGKAAWPPLGLCDGLLARGRQRLFNDEKRSERTKEHKTRAEKGAALESRAARCLPRNELGSVTPAGSIANSPNRRQAHLSPFHMRVVNAPRRIDQEPAEAAHVLNDARCRDRGGEVKL